VVATVGDKVSVRPGSSLKIRSGTIDTIAQGMVTMRWGSKGSQIGIYTPAELCLAGSADYRPPAAVVIGKTRLMAGDHARVRKTATGRKTAKDAREGTVDEILQGGRVVLLWGTKPHEKGAYEAKELEPIDKPDDAPLPPLLKNGGPVLNPAAAWPFPRAH
jgi:hypothetical protein